LFIVNCDTDNGTKTYTVTFNSNGGSAVAAITGISSGSTISLPTPPTKDTDTFGGWYKDNGTWANQFTSSTVITADIIVYAKWNPEGSGQIITVSNIDASFNSNYIFIAFAVDENTIVGGISQINNGSADILLKIMDGDMNLTDTNWEGAGIFLISCRIFEDIAMENILREGTAANISINSTSGTDIDGEDIVYQYPFNKDDPNSYNQLYVDVTVTFNGGIIPEEYNVEAMLFMDSDCSQQYSGSAFVGGSQPDQMPLAFDIKISAFYEPLTVYFGIALVKRDDHSIITVKPTEMSLLLSAGPNEYTTHINLGTVNIVYSLP
jgi:uncharacterized repeat protein (TIGR02543 family)